MRWPEVISNEDLWEMTNQQPIKQQIKQIDRPQAKENKRR